MQQGTGGSSDALSEPLCNPREFSEHRRVDFPWQHHNATAARRTWYSQFVKSFRQRREKCVCWGGGGARWADEQPNFVGGGGATPPGG